MVLDKLQRAIFMALFPLKLIVIFKKLLSTGVASSLGAMKTKNTVDLPFNAFAIIRFPCASARDLILTMV